MWSKIEKLPWRLSIRTYFIVMNMVVLCLLFPSVSIIFFHEETAFRDAQLARTIRQLRESLESRGATLAHSMALSAEQAVAGYDFSFLNIMVAQVVASDPEIRYCVIMNNSRLAVVHSRPDLVGWELDGPLDQRAASILADEFPPAVADRNQETQVRFIEGVEGEDATLVLEAIVPLYIGNQRWGGLRLGFSLAEHQRRIRQIEENWAERRNHFRIYFLTLIAFFFSVGVLVAGLFTRFFVNSVKILHDGVKRVGYGDLSHTIGQQGLVCDEIQDLSEAFNAMTDKLRLSYSQLDEYSKGLEQKVEERTRELRKAQASLMQQAHEAGMAEMAVGILHNIGNAITPAKVGATLILKRLDESPVRLHVGEAIRQLEGAVAAAVAEPAERERLLAILRLLPAGISYDYDWVAEELRHIREKHEHIEGIIKLQMRYARLMGTSDEIDIIRVTEDALRMLEQSLPKRSVRVETSFEPVPPVRIEGTKLLQVVVNLIKNGYEAMDGMAPEERRLELATHFEPGGPGLTVLVVRDNGVGFTPAEKEQLFKFGYTTKSQGSGFGLHSCANYLIANGGSIEATSPGKGKGAEFKVRLPAAKRSGSQE